ncbi:3-hydroxybutyryl-CoA dehydrogenase [Craterilacuibacter sp.]|uniref:3-hydroxybutyryl-CoA dehydrogenase n=1 Tax=Craterilacuibacter sp. TaxID=2870909 RepID=UPI003F2E8D08
MKISMAGVIGAGTMGSGIAQTLATHGVEVTLSDVSEEALARALDNIHSSLSRLAQKGVLDLSTLPAILARIRTATSADIHRHSQIVIEAASENEAIKQQLLRELDGIVPADTVIASNTSSISLTRIASWVSHPERVIGMHFMNPVPLMQLVEVIRALQSSDQSCDTVMELARTLGKTPVEVRDAAGFVSNRILMPMINEAAFTIYEGIASAADVDTVMKLGMNHPIGPLALADLIGLDTCLAIMDILHTEFRDSKYRACPLLVQLVAAGQLGRKSGHGFFPYSV